MAKVTNFQTIADVIYHELALNNYDIETLIGTDCTVWAVMAIYLNNDKTSGYGQDFGCRQDIWQSDNKTRLSVISSRNRVSVILEGQMSYYTDNVDLCGYESLEEDIQAILLWIQTAIDRINAR